MKKSCPKNKFFKTSEKSPKLIKLIKIRAIE